MRNFRKGKTNLLRKKADQELPEGVGEGEGTHSWWHQEAYGGENVQLSTVAAGYTGMYILIKTLSMVPFIQMY